MKTFKYKLLKTGKVVGVWYSGNKKSDMIIVYGKGAPTVPDNGDQKEAFVFLSYGFDVFVPDYIGFGRSDGVFTPKNCIKTFLCLYDAFKKGCVAKNAYENSKIYLKYKRIIFAGKSLAGAYIPLLPRFNKEIKELAIFCPVVDQAAQGKIAGEETNQDFLRSMKKDGYYHLYRGVLSSVWKKHLENKDGLSPMNNIKYLSKAKLFIAHGKKDKCIDYSKSIIYYKKIIQTFPKNKSQFKVKIYPNGGHDEKTTIPAVRDFINWIT